MHSVTHTHNTLSYALMSDTVINAYQTHVLEFFTLTIEYVKA